MDTLTNCSFVMGKERKKRAKETRDGDSDRGNEGVRAKEGERYEQHTTSVLASAAQYARARSALFSFVEMYKDVLHPPVSKSSSAPRVQPFGTSRHPKQTFLASCFFAIASSARSPVRCAFFLNPA
jgi:hypothetical protein